MQNLQKSRKDVTDQSFSVSDSDGQSGFRHFGKRGLASAEGNAFSSEAVEEKYFEVSRLRKRKLGIKSMQIADMMNNGPQAFQHQPPSQLRKMVMDMVSD